MNLESGRDETRVTSSNSDDLYTDKDHSSSRACIARTRVCGVGTCHTVLRASKGSEHSRSAYTLLVHHGRDASHESGEMSHFAGLCVMAICISVAPFVCNAKMIDSIDN